MKISRIIISRFPVALKYNFRRVLVIAICWTVIDIIWTRYFHFLPNLNNEHLIHFTSIKAILLRGVIVFFMSYLMGWLLFFGMRHTLRNSSLLMTLVAKTGIILLAALAMNFLLHFTQLAFVSNLSFSTSWQIFFSDASSVLWLLHHSVGWIALFLITQLGVEFQEKYSPGVFWEILIGKYIQPKVEKRIIMFLDLNDSTTIAEGLDSKKYFSFLRDFIYFVSIALIEYDGHIYQYIGDEIVVSWSNTSYNKLNCLDAVGIASRLLQKNSNYFQKRYGVVPKFSTGLHVGEVTVGEIGIIKKDIVMSGDTMNTASRICDYGKSVNAMCVASAEFISDITISWETTNFGPVDLKGKNESVELFAVNM
ncbi:MAG: adenylate/guanylate cyclase [Chitinophagaceae bacterium]|nr:adenylate/guanylate cyclase [Chitinophagaceae bacterium]